MNLFTHVIDWNEFKQLQRAYFKANVIDIEALTDHAIQATLYRAAKLYNIKYILQGFNRNTELILPKSWTFNKLDDTNIKDIILKNTNQEIKTFPTLTAEDSKRYSKIISTINIYDYHKFEHKYAISILKEHLNYNPYTNKHFESVFTRFYQGYILPRKFKIDKRRAHLSCMICLGTTRREDALNELQSEIYSTEMQKDDYEYILKKLEFTKDEFELYLNAPAVSHFNYAANFTSIFRKKINLPDKIVNRIIKGLYH